jgi:hypothetical protein
VMIAGKLRRFANDLLLEGPGRRKSLTEWKQALAKSGETLVARAEKATGDETKTRNALNHIIGIERWAQRRLRVFSGEAPVRDEYDPYRPGTGLQVSDLIAAFRAAREETIALVETLANIPEAERPETVEHNQHGPLSLYGWIRYLDMHASWEAKRIR